MRLLTRNSRNELRLTQVLRDHQIPPYAVLSHTWGADSDEVSLADLQQGRAEDKVGYRKLQFCNEQAERDQIKHFWIDTCCIDKTDGVELSEAINSMYKWYRDAEKCYVYLSDVSADQSANEFGGPARWESSMRTSRWFTRGWTLQELLAPKVVEFFSHSGIFLGTKRTLAQQIYEITNLPLAALYGTPPAQFPIAERWRWAQERQTSRVEDRAYCLLGIFEAFMPLIYGEGEHAFLRLEETVSKRTGGSAYAPVSNGTTAESLAPSPCAGLKKHLYVDNGHVGRALKRRSMIPAEIGSIQCHDRVIHEGRFEVGHKYNSLMKSLLFDRFDFRVNNVKKALFSTSQWLFRHAHFQAWHESGGIDQQAGLLWIKGKPGCGKSTLVKAAVEWTRWQTGEHRGQDAIVPYFFDARASTSLEKSSLGLYRTVVHHLLFSYPPLKILFANKFALKNPGPSGEHWTVKEMQEFLYDAVESKVLCRLILFIDALNEAEYEDDLRQMINFLFQLSDRAIATGGLCRLQICLSSRHYPCIRVGRGLSLVVEDQPEHGEDIDTYITKQLSCLDGPDKDDIRAEILSKSARVFLWVVLVVQVLNKLDDYGASLSDMRARLETMPTDLWDLFKDILTTNDQGIETSILLFRWMVFRMRPLEPAELFFAMEYSRSPHTLTRALPTEIYQPSPDRLARYFLNYSRGLVEVVEVTSSRTGVLQFIHETVHEFLLRGNGLALIVPDLSVNFAGTSHEILRIACLRRILTTQIPTEYEYFCEAAHQSDYSYDAFQYDMRLKLPFLDYAVLHLFQHAEQAQTHNISQQAFLQHQIDGHGLWLNPHRRWWNVLVRHKYWKVAPSVTLTFFIAERRHLSLLPVVLGISNTIDVICKPRGSVLYTASLQGAREIVQILLDNGANVNVQGGYFGNALQAALVNGDEQIVQMLLDNDADVNAQGGEYGNALQTAAAGGQKHLVQMLLDKGANVHAQGGLHGSALHAASVCGREQIIQILLDNGADINAQEGDYGSVPR